MIQLRLLILSLLLLSTTAHEHHGDEDSSKGNCSSSGARITAEYRPGLVTIDGHDNEWAEIDGLDFSLLPALDFDKDKAYPGGKMTVKALHDGVNIFFMLQVDGDYAYTRGASTKCPSVALMFQVGENATYNDMGGCKDMPGTCTNKSCQGHEVDIMHFSIGKTAIPGRLYGGNPVDNAEGIGADRFGHLVDLYSWNPHCRYLDGKTPSGTISHALNDWHGAWWHTSLAFRTVAPSGFIEDDSPYGKGGEKGMYVFEFSRPLRTMDLSQQDVQFTIGQTSKLAVAFWFPVNGNAWVGSQHYSVNCDWLPLDIISPGVSASRVASRGSWDAISAFSLIMSVVALCLSVCVGYFASKTKSVPFTPIDRL